MERSDYPGPDEVEALGPFDEDGLEPPGTDTASPCDVKPIGELRSHHDTERLEGYVREALFHVPSLARRYAGRGLSLDELVAAGNLGLVEAALRFDPSRNVRFSTYANWWIRKAIIEALGHQSGPMRLPRYQYDRLRTVRDARARWLARFGAEPDKEQLAGAAGLPLDEVERLLGLVTAAVSLEQPLTPSDSRPVKDVIEDQDAESPYGALLRQDMTRRVRRRLTDLGARERQVLSLRFGLGDSKPMTLRETGRRLGISRERVRQVEMRALTKLRELI